MPATRTLGAQLGVARGVAVSAYEQLIAEGYLVAGHGTGTRVSADVQARRDTSTDISEPQRFAAVSTSPVSSRGTTLPLAPGVPDTSSVDRPSWRAAWRHAMALAHVEAPSLGDPHLRAEIADHLRRMRGTTRTPADVIVTAGARDGLGLILTALGTTSGRQLVVGVEDPGYPSLRRVAARHGAQIVALPVDADGLDPSALPDTLLDAIIVTPSHQYPLGGSLSLSRRQALLDWAVRSGAVIIEDDYDAELRHTGSPLPALAALDSATDGAVALLGTFSSTVSPALAAGFLLAPERLRRLIEPVRQDLGGTVSSVVQLALAEYLASGELRRHTARMRRRYALRRTLVVEQLATVPGVSVRPMQGGLHAVIEFGTGPDAAAAEARTLWRSTELQLGAVGLSSYWHHHTMGAERYGLVIGTGGGDVAFPKALTQLCELLQDEFGQ